MWSVSAITRPYGSSLIVSIVVVLLQWQRPLRVEGVLALVERGVDSEQKRVQAEREGKVLAQLFLSKSRCVGGCVGGRVCMVCGRVWVVCVL